ncbi:MAG: hypothetical protein QOC66_1779 [Pseudonocardiales bacterium]|nr:hypothetical protein [Pseudonocardiales bacterium]
MGFAAFGAFWGTWGASLPRVQSHAAVTDAELGLALLWVGGGALASIWWAGRLSDRFDRGVVAWSTAALAGAGVLTVFARGVAQLSIALLVVGICSGAADAAINAAATRAEGGGGAVVNLAHGVFSVAVVASSLGVAAAARNGEGGRPWALIAIGVLLVVAAVVSIKLSTPAPVEVRAQTGPHRRWSPQLLILGGLAALAYLVENAWQSWGAIQLHTSVGASLGISALAPAVFASSAAAGRFAGHALTNAVPAATLFALGAVTAAGGSALGALAPSTALVLLGIAVAGLGTSVCAPTLIGLAGQSAPDARGNATGAVITIAYLGFVFGPAAVGLVSGAATLPIALVGVAVIAGVLVLASPILAKLDTYGAKP